MGGKGPKNSRWKGGRRIRKDGYVLAYSPGHPYACKNFVLEHRLVMERAIGRHLHPDEIVHHVNEDKGDNRLENLELTDRPAHGRHHHKGRKFPNRFRPRIDRDTLHRLYIVERNTLRDVAAQTGISYGSLRHHCFVFGIPIRRKDPWHKRRRSA